MRLPSRNPACDAVVQQAIAQGEFRQAAAELTRGYQHEVVRCCTDYLGSEAEGQDVAQDIFLGAYTAMARFRGEASVHTWLCAIFTRQCCKALRKCLHEGGRLTDLASAFKALRQRLLEKGQLTDLASAFEEGLSGPLPSPDEDPEERIQRVMRGLRTLNKDEQVVLRMRYLGDEPVAVADMAKYLGISKRSVERRLAQALRHLHEVVNHAP